MVARPGGKQKTQEKKTERYRADHPKVYGLQTSCARIKKAKTAGCRLRFMLLRKEERKNEKLNLSNYIVPFKF